jgi:hypothetical protein
MTPSVSKGQWFKLPRGKVAEVCMVKTGHRPEVVLRYLDNDGAMAPGEFVLTLEFLLKHGARVIVAPPVLV